MKILFTGGGTGGHFYPIIATAEAVNDIAHERHLIEPELYYAAPDPYDREMLIANNVKFVPTSAGKMRRYFSFMNVIDVFKTGWGIVRSVLRVFFLYPDVVFGKGGYASFPTLLAAKLFSIPVVIHESDSVPGRTNLWAGKFAKKIAVSFEEATNSFPKEKVEVTGNPVRKSILRTSSEGAYEYLKLAREVPIILVLGGSQGAAPINDAIILALPELVKDYQIIHQTGDLNLEDVQGRAKISLTDSTHADRYKPFGYLNDLALRMAAGAASIVISRGGSTIFEIAAWGLPSIIIPLPSAAEDHQRKNAYTYARSGAASVIEQNNLTTGVLVGEINRILSNAQVLGSMQESAKKFSGGNEAARKIAAMLLDIAVSHEK